MGLIIETAYHVSRDYIKAGVDGILTGSLYLTTDKSEPVGVVSTANSHPLTPARVDRFLPLYCHDISVNVIINIRDGNNNADDEQADINEAISNSEKQVLIAWLKKEFISQLSICTLDPQLGRDTEWFEFQSLMTHQRENHLRFNTLTSAIQERKARAGALARAKLVGLRDDANVQQLWAKHKDSMFAPESAQSLMNDILNTAGS